MIGRPTVSRDAEDDKVFFQPNLIEFQEYQFTTPHQSPNEMPSFNALPFDKEERK